MILSFLKRKFYQTPNHNSVTCTKPNNSFVASVLPADVSSSLWRRNTYWYILYEYYVYCQMPSFSGRYLKPSCLISPIVPFIYYPFLTHLSWKLKWAFLITFSPSSVCPSVCKLFLFSTSSKEPLGQFQPNLVHNILGWSEFKSVQIKDPVHFQGEVIAKNENTLTKL